MIKTTSKNAFFLLEVAVFEDSELSFAARGLFAYIQSQGGSINMEDVNFKDKINRKALDELIDVDLILITNGQI